MVPYTAYALDRQGNVMPGAMIDVFITGTATRPDLFEDAAGAEPLANPFEADINGKLKFFIVDGNYDIQCTGVGAQAAFTGRIDGVVVVDVVEAVASVDSGVRTMVMGEQMTADAFNTPSSMRAFAAAVRKKTAKVVFVGDSLMFGFRAPAQASPAGIFARRIKRLFQSCTFTILDRSLPGSKLEEFLDVGFYPSSSFSAGAGTPAGTPGRDAYNVDTEEELTHRWPEGAASFNATAWQDVVKNDLPDLIVIGIGFNDLNALDRTIYQQKLNWISFYTWLSTVVSSTETMPSVCIVTPHSGSPAYFIPTVEMDDYVRGYHQMMRIVARFYDWGLWDAGRLYDKYVRGVDPLRFQFSIDRYLDGIVDGGDPILWQIDALGAAASAYQITGAGTAAVTIDSTGLHSAAAQVNIVRKVGSGGAGVHFNIRKLATDADAVTVSFGNPRTGNTLSSTKRNVLKFYNAAGVGKVSLYADGTLYGTGNLPTPIPTSDAADYWVQVHYDGKDIQVWAAGASNPQVPTANFQLFPHQPTWPAIGYENLTAAPSVKIKEIVFNIGAETPIRVGLVTEDEAFGSVVSATDYFTSNRPESGDGGLHFSGYGNHLFYGDSLAFVLDAVRNATASLQMAYIPKTADFTLDGSLDGCIVGCSIASPALLTVTIPGPAVLAGSAKLYAGYSVEVSKVSTGNIAFVSSGADSTVLGDWGVLAVVNRYRSARISLLRITAAGVYVWMVTQGNAQVAEANSGHALYLGCHSNGTNVIADTANAVMIVASNALNSYAVYFDTGLTPGDVWAPTLRWFIDALGRVGGLGDLGMHNNATVPTSNSLAYIASGTYVPTLTGTTNVAAVDMTTGDWTWMRVGKVVTVSGMLRMTPTAAAPTNTLIGISLPIPTNIVGVGELCGTACCATLAAASGASAGVFGDATNDRATMRWSAGVTTANQLWAVHFTYLIKA